jgi:hypothetical protein
MEHEWRGVCSQSSASYGPGPLPDLAGAGDSPVPGQTCSRQTVLSRIHASGVSSGISLAAARPSLYAWKRDPSGGSAHDQTWIPSFAAGARPVSTSPTGSPLRRAAHTPAGSPGVQRAGQATGISSGQTYVPSSTSTNASARRTTSHGAPDHADLRRSWPGRKMMQD